MHCFRKTLFANSGGGRPAYRCLLLGIQWPREVLYRRIDMRVDERMQQGMVQETRNLLMQGISHERLEALGLEYRLTSLWLQGKFSSEAEMTQRLKYACHDFARRQLTWFRRDKRIIWIDGIEGDEENKEVLGAADNIIQEFLKSIRPKDIA